MSKPKKRKFLPNMATIFIGGAPMLLKLIPGTKEEAALLSCMREPRHAEAGVEGEACACANANAQMEHNYHLTGKHMLSIFTDSRNYIVEKWVRSKRYGIYGIAKVFEHKMGAMQAKFDKHKKAFIRSSEATGPVTITAYSSHIRSKKAGKKGGKVKTKQQGGTGRKPIEQTEAQRKGSLRRCQRVNIMPSDVAA